MRRLRGHFVCGDVARVLLTGFGDLDMVFGVTCARCERALRSMFWNNIGNDVVLRWGLGLIRWCGGLCAVGVVYEMDRAARYQLLAASRHRYIRNDILMRYLVRWSLHTVQVHFSLVSN